MKNQKMKLSDLKIKSFVTRLSDNNSGTVKGGNYESGADGCDSYDCSAYQTGCCVQSSKLVTNSDGIPCSGATQDAACTAGDSQQNSINNCTVEC